MDKQTEELIKKKTEEAFDNGLVIGVSFGMLSAIIIYSVMPLIFR